MAACMNGLATYGGFIPFGGTFLAFSDYCRPSIRLSALMKLRVIYIMTHDSIGLGEDGPTHQPVEHISSLRAIPNLYVFRPANAYETIDSWKCALSLTDAPSVLVLSRQKLQMPYLENYKYTSNYLHQGAYILHESNNFSGINTDVTIFATGSEVDIAYEAALSLESLNIPVRVVSVPCMELFSSGDKQYKFNILCNSSIKVAVEAGVELGWQKFIGAHGTFIGMKSFGASAPSSVLYEHFNISAQMVVETVKHKLENKSC